MRLLYTRLTLETRLCLMKRTSIAILFHVTKTFKGRSSKNTIVFFPGSRYSTHHGRLDVSKIAMAKQIFKGCDDQYNGITIDSIEEACDSKIFAERLKDSLEQWTKDKKRTIWFRVHIPNTEWIPILTGQGFTFHHAKEGYVMLYRWLPNDEVCNIPKYAHTFLGVGAFVFNKDTNEVLVIKEKYAPNRAWKLPGGYVEPGENIEVAAKREVFEETGIQTDFKCLVCFRHGHDYLFGCSDIYMIAYLIPQDFQIQKCKWEILECNWMKLTEFMQHPEVHANNKYLMKKIIDFLQHEMGMVANYEVHPITKKQICVYGIENTDVGTFIE
ncbi:uncharacterized protein LOC126853482 [Cataglyphis hispanica]|uniref:uncharacterized protein LOC126853482 n=1 Tax=Cataglyphis hispanica TaxID=1086592 RepID=UPI00217FAFEF|nr:uncharacterized protein LOC126853482 [Cataglyphis hispanica]